MSASIINGICDNGRFINVDEYQFQDVDENVFGRIMQSNKPAIIRDVNFGFCSKGWTLDYLSRKLKDETIVIHESNETDLDFLSKNFKYQTCLFSELSQKLKDNKSNVYLRSTNRDIRAKKPARIEDEFSCLSQDLLPPGFVPFGSRSNLYHSSVLRIASAGIQIWTHFDLYDNVLCQTVGTKRIILLPPEDIRYLYCKGDKSPVNSFDDWEDLVQVYPLMEKSTPHRCILNPGDLIFIPSLWWHNIRTIPISTGEEHYSIGFNIFWKDAVVESKSLYASSDVYGNKNLKPFESALSNLDKVVEHIDKLPGKYRMFYKLMILRKLEEKLFSLES